ncbi:MAG: hypothetical protein U0869_05090 [Chloroflexota bacterium]
MTSVMIEVRRGLYCDERTGEQGAAFPEVAALLRRVVGAVLAGDPAEDAPAPDLVR